MTKKRTVGTDRHEHRCKDSSYRSWNGYSRSSLAVYTGRMGTGFRARYPGGAVYECTDVGGDTCVFGSSIFGDSADFCSPGVLDWSLRLCGI